MAFSLLFNSLLAATLILCFITIINGEHIKLAGPFGETLEIMRGKNLSCVICDNKPSTELQERLNQQEKTITNLEARVETLEQLLEALLANSSQQTSTLKPTTIPTTESTTDASTLKPATAPPRRKLCNTRKPPNFSALPVDWCLPSYNRLRVTKPNKHTTTVSKYCYHFGGQTAHHRASQTCKRKRGALAEFPDMQEYEIVKAYLEQNKQGNNRFWIGGHASKEDHTKFIWPSSGTPISNTTWVPTEPTYTYQGKKEKCVSFDGRGRHLDDGGVYYGGWRQYDTNVFTGYGLNDEFCVGQYLDFICHRPASNL